jgi:hypothetical protein
MKHSGTSFLLAAVTLAAGVVPFSCLRAADENPFTISIAQGDAQVAGVGQAFAQQFEVTLTDPHGTPLQGVQVNFENVGCLRLLGSPCEFPAPPGHFVSGADNATVTTSLAGVAIAPAYYAGFGVGAIGVAANVVPNEPPYFFTTPEVLTHIAVFRLNQVPDPVPTLSVWVRVVLAMLLAACGQILRSKKSRSPS